jgi:hypothetical protein
MESQEIETVESAPAMIMNTLQEPILHEVFGVTATQTELIYVVDVDLTDMYGNRYRCDYVSNPDDTYGLGPTIRQWLVEHEGEYVIQPYVEPPPQPYSINVSTLWGRMTDEEAEAFDSAMATASPLRLRRQFLSAQTMMSDSELCTFARGVLVTVVTEIRCDELLAQ